MVSFKFTSKLKTKQKMIDFIFANRYDVRVRSKVEGALDVPDMWSNFSYLTIRLASRIPDEPPKTDIGGFHIDDNNNIYIYWNKLPESKQNGPNPHYVIYYQSNDINGRM